MIFEFVHDGQIHKVELKDNRFAVVDGNPQVIEIDYSPTGRIYLIDSNTRREICTAANGDKTYIDIDGVLFEFTQPQDEIGGSGGAGGHAADPHKVFAPMPGKIVKLMVGVGDKVEPKQHLVIVEAMKMENIIVAHGTGKVKAINFSEGQQCDTETPLVELEAAE
jgi:biotin carboxyl carrier protein